MIKIWNTWSILCLYLLKLSSSWMSVRLKVWYCWTDTADSWDFSLPDSWKVNKSHQGGSCTHPDSQWLTGAWIFLLTFSEQFRVSVWLASERRSTYLMYSGQSIVPGLCLWCTQDFECTCDISVEETLQAYVENNETVWGSN